MEVKRGSLIVAFLMLMSAFYASLTIIPDTARATILYVGGSGPSNYTTIQDAVNASFPGDIVYVFNGTYNETVKIDKSISLVGEDRNTTMINGTGNVDAVNVTAHYVNISGIGMRSTEWGYAGIKLYNASNCRIIDNYVVGSYYGIHLDLSHDNYVLYNYLNWTGGTRLTHSHNNTIIGNYASDSRIGIILLSSDHNLVSDNTAIDSNSGGISLGHSQNNIISKNTLIESNNWGVMLYYSNNTTVVDNSIREHNYGIDLWGCNRAYVSNNSFSWIYRHGIDLYYSDHITVINAKVDVRIRFSNYSTILDSNVAGILVEGYLLEHWNTHTINDVYRSGAPVVYWKNTGGGTIPQGASEIILAICTGITIENQTLDSKYMGIGLAFSSGITAFNNTVYVNDGDGITLYYANYSRITSSYIMTDHYAITLSGSSGNIITDNRASNNVVGVTMMYSHNNVVAHNDVSGGRYPIGLGYSNNNTILNNQGSDTNGGFQLGYSDNNTIVGNNASSCVNNGLTLASSYNNTILDNIFLNNGRIGIEIQDSDNNTFDGNRLSQSTYDGFWLALSNDNTITNNTIMNNEVGLHAIQSDNSTIANNTIAGNLEGVNLTISNNNSVYHNNISFNILQAYDDTDTNQWDNGYPSGGNYWSDYSGIDNCSGPNQDVCPDPDVIGDTPYIIDADSQDRYPLMFPYGTVLPRPPAFRRASLSGNDWENVTLVWALSPDDGSGYDTVVGYEIYKNTTYDSQGLNYQLIASLPSGASEYVDNFSGEGDPSNYFYQVCAIDIFNNTTCAKTQAAKFTRQLTAMPNLVSIPLIQSDRNVETVLQTVSYDNAWSYDPINQEWRSFSKSKPYAQSLEYLNHTKGIWVNVTQDSNLTVAGVVPTSTTIDLQAGWNLLGFPSFDDNYTVAELKAAVAVERIEGFDGLAPPYFLRVMMDGDFLQTGFGYWIRVQSPAVWTVENT